ncbi:MAG: thioredoxin domain-containing protein [Phycisphaerales bacterium]
MSESTTTFCLRNRLGESSSRYLQQHATNPVHWQLWDDEAFNAARTLNRPIFLSVGYSTCYWCHVMERESFESAAVAEILNTNFVPIKVDRERRPDVDELYMRATQALNGGAGGWPMNVWLEPDTLRPFLAGTYFPPQDRGTTRGFASVLREIDGFWRSRRDEVRGQASKVAEMVVAAGDPVPPPDAPELLDEAIVAQTVDHLLESHDPRRGGFGSGTNKFPTPAYLDLLMDAGWDRKESKAAVTVTLDRMAMGGIFDQVGGGFHRYSTDRRWIVPHFEKMLYDNAQLLATYTRGVERTSDPFYVDIVRRIVGWAERDMRQPSGGFSSAQDAEADRREGSNYLWTEAELRELLTAKGRADDVPKLFKTYGIDRGPNFRDPHDASVPPSSVLFLPDRPDRLAVRLGMGEDEFHDWLASIDEILEATRRSRPQPMTDDQVLASWNGMMIQGMANAGRALEDDGIVRGAARAAIFVLEHMRHDNGGVVRSWRDGVVGRAGFLKDHANVVRGLLALHAATGESMWVEAAGEILEAAVRDFHVAGDGWWDVRDGERDLFARVRTIHDGATPSGTAAVLHALIEYGEATGEERWITMAAEDLAATRSRIIAHPAGSALSVLAAYRIMRHHPVASEVFGGPRPEPEALEAVSGRTIRAPKAPTPPQGASVMVSCSHSELHLADGETAPMTLIVAIADGLHVGANDPGVEGIQGLTVSVPEDAGIRLNLDYPMGDVSEGPLGMTFMHVGRVAIPMVARRVGSGPENVTISVSAQPCSDSACQAPVVLPVTIHLAM